MISEGESGDGDGEGDVGGWLREGDGEECWWWWGLIREGDGDAWIKIWTGEGDGRQGMGEATGVGEIWSVILGNQIPGIKSRIREFRTPKLVSKVSFPESRFFDQLDFKT